jgi:hypothetical protein
MGRPPPPLLRGASQPASSCCTYPVPPGIAVGICHPGRVQTDMGGSKAEITADQSATGLTARFDALTLTTTGCFQTWDGRPHPY